MTGCSLRGHAAVVAAGLLALAALAGCGGTAVAPRSEFIPFTPEQRTVLQGQTTRSYRIQEGDVLRVHFAYEKNLDQDFVHVLSDGTVNLVGVNSIRLAGMTMAEADSLLTRAYSREYREPALSVMMQETQGRRVYVLGMVRNPGLYKVPEDGLDVVNAVAVAGGFTDDASKGNTVVVRVTNEGYQCQEVNLDDIGKPEFALLAAMQLEPYDVVYVPRSGSGNFNYFSRTVLAGIGNLTRILYDLRYITSGKLVGGY